jgi:hypothetical protein
MDPIAFVQHQSKRLYKRIKSWWLERQGLANIPADGSDIDYLRDLQAWDYPDERAGQRHREKMLFKGGDADVWSTTIAEMGEMGVGMSLYFIFLKKLCWFFFMATILSLPALALNWGGRGITEDLADPMMLVHTTVANQGLTLDNMEIGYCLEHESICNGTTRSVYGMEVPSNYVAYTVTACDLLYSMCFLWFMFSFRRRIHKEVGRADADNITADDYGIFVRGLPRDASETNVLDHFSNRYELDMPHAYFPHICGCFGPPMEEEQHDEEDSALPPQLHNLKQRPKYPLRYNDHQTGTNNPNAQHYLNTWVSEVSIAHPSGASIRFFLANTELSKKINEAERNVKKFEKNTAWKDGADNKKKDKAIRQLRKVKAQMRRLNNMVKEKERKMRQNPKDVCVGAFVIFNNEESYAMCLDDYRTSTSFLSRIFQRKELRFVDKRGEHWPLQVVAAPEPKSIKWENLEDGALERMLRRTISSIAVITILFISFAFVTVVATVQQRNAKAMGDLTVCRDLPAQYAGGYAFDKEENEFEYQPELDHKCPNGFYYISYPGGASEELDSPAVWTAAPTAAPTMYWNQSWSEGCSDSCSFSNNGQCDDGGYGSEYTYKGLEYRRNDCRCGTDCGDCGPRPPEQCPNTTEQYDNAITGYLIPEWAQELGWRLLTHDERQPDHVYEGTYQHLITYDKVSRTSLEYSISTKHTHADSDTFHPDYNHTMDYDVLTYNVQSMCTDPCVKLGESAPLMRSEGSVTASPTSSPSSSPTAAPTATPTTMPTDSSNNTWSANFTGLGADDDSAFMRAMNYGPGDPQKCFTLPCFVETWQKNDFGGRKCRDFDRGAAFSCYCNGQLQKAILEEGLIFGAQGLILGKEGENGEPICKTFVEQYLMAEILMNAQSGFIVVVNLVLELAMYKLTEMERHHSKSQFSASLCMKIFLAQFLNTALVIMLVNARLPNNVKFPLGESVGVLSGPYDDFRYHPSYLLCSLSPSPSLAQMSCTYSCFRSILAARGTRVWACRSR